MCRRELEGQKEWTIGKCLLPAILVHGMFDFVLFVTSFEYGLYYSSSASQQDDQNKNAGVVSDDLMMNTVSIPVNPLYIFLNFILPLIIAASGLLYYWIESRSQKLRLKSLDAQSNVPDQAEVVV